jgi:glutamate dehydrogenase/leucine dehydrogenase
MKDHLIVLPGRGYASPSTDPRLARKLEELSEATPAAPADDERSALPLEAQRLVAEWDGHAVVAGFDGPTRTWVFVALHDSTLGLTAGGCRMQVYAEHVGALADAMRLAEAMTSKWAVTGLGYGGGKAVLSIPRALSPSEREGLFRRFGRVLESLGGVYQTGPDLGTSSQDMAVLAECTSYSNGFDRKTGGPVDSGLYTALGVRRGIEEAAKFVYGEAGLKGRAVVVEGLGGVGGALARMLAAAGAELVLSDIDERRARALGDELGCLVLEPGRVYAYPCDVYAPCAVGGTLNRETAETLRCRIVAGAANNQLADESVSELLHSRGVFYVPDFVLNAGGAMALTMISGGAPDEEVRGRVEGIAATLAEVFAEAASSDSTPLAAARRRVARALESARDSTPKLSD